MRPADGHIPQVTCENVKYLSVFQQQRRQEKPPAGCTRSQTSETDGQKSLFVAVQPRAHTHRPIFLNFSPQIPRSTSRNSTTAPETPETDLLRQRNSDFKDARCLHKAAACARPWFLTHPHPYIHTATTHQRVRASNPQQPTFAGGARSSH